MPNHSENHDHHKHDAAHDEHGHGSLDVMVFTVMAMVTSTIMVMISVRSMLVL
jgi:ABC-type Zn2+ transport system substrate-binding protein/surface adhesin